MAQRRKKSKTPVIIISIVAAVVVIAGAITGVYFSHTCDICKKHYLVGKKVESLLVTYNCCNDCYDKVGKYGDPEAWKDAINGAGDKINDAVDNLKDGINDLIA